MQLEREKEREELVTMQFLKTVHASRIWSNKKTNATMIIVSNTHAQYLTNKC